MQLHEFQTKDTLFRSYNLPVPDGEMATSVDEAISAYSKLGLERCVVKAQVHAGGRGKAGGVRLVDNKPALAEVVKQLIGSRLVTYQTTEEGQPVHHVLIEEPCQISRELYLSVMVDRSTEKIVVMASTEGGVDIEAVAEETPEKISRIYVDPLIGVLPYQSRKLAVALELKGSQIKQFSHIIVQMIKMFIEMDLSMVEVNPLVVNSKGELICLDGKISVDDNAMFRQPRLKEMRDPSQEDERENHAKQWELNYIALKGSIGCMVNGAGLAMATMDLIKLNGGQPANFLDVGGGATKERVAEAFKIILSDDSVKSVLVNIFGGIVRCDLIADGIIGALADVATNLPVIVRLEGHNAELGRKKLKDSGLNVTPANSFQEAAELSVKLAKIEEGI
ncbi:MAG TPA: ADP-forming succinate--CoA ligase subunit beta [Gammaproteobacteria bacterium]|nr:ADP-forming succinate--CoA ligase subunit beta [Gammaproteobacteria bacterium]